jgi:hypothetical protein
MSGGALASLWIIGSVAIAGALSALVVYGWPALMDWALPRLARWHSRQIRRANVPQPYPPDPVEWAPLLFILPLVALVVAIVWRNGVRR